MYEYRRPFPEAVKLLTLRELHLGQNGRGGKYAAEHAVQR